MPFISATERALLWAVGDPVVASGVTEPGDTTVTGLAMVSAADENEFLGAVAGKAGSYKPLPAMGEWIEAGIYGYGDGLVIVRQSHTRQNNPDDAGVGALYGIYRPGTEVWEWVAGESLAVGARRSYEGVAYELYRDIGANNWFPPPQVAAHWRVVVETPGEWVSGEQLTYDPANPIYRVYLGITYRLRQNPGVNIWPPPSVPALWEEIV